MARATHKAQQRHRQSWARSHSGDVNQSIKNIHNHLSVAPHCTPATGSGCCQRSGQRSGHSYMSSTAQQLCAAGYTQQPHTMSSGSLEARPAAAAVADAADSSGTACILNVVPATAVACSWRRLVAAVAPA